MPDVTLADALLPGPGSRPLRGYLARPEGSGPWPGVVVIPEVFGLDDVMRRQADRLARAGYLTLAVDLYSVGGMRRCVVSTMRAMYKGEGRAYVDIETARQWLRNSTECTGRIGVVGFCMGGGFALICASRGFDVASANYATLPKELDAALVGACPIVGSYGARDRSLKGAAAKLDAALTRAGVEHDVREYPNAGHAFLNDAMAGPMALRPILRVMGVKPEPDSAADAWARIEAFFSTHLR